MSDSSVPHQTPTVGEYIGLPSGHTPASEVLLPERMSGLELGILAGTVASEKRAMQLGCIGVLGSGGSRRVADVRADYVGLVPGIDVFVNSNNLWTDIKNSPQELVIAETDKDTPAEYMVDLTPLGNVATAMAGDFLDFSHRHNIALRTIFGTGLGLPADRSADLEGVFTTQERYMALGFGMLSRNKPQTREDFDNDPQYTGIHQKTIDGILRSWHEEGLVVKDLTSQGRFLWALSSRGTEIFSELKDMLAPYILRDETAHLNGQLKLHSFLTEETYKKVLPMLFRRDYIASGALQRARLRELGKAVNDAIRLADLQPGHRLSTSEVGTLIGEKLAPRQLHMVSWWLGKGCQLAVDPKESHARKTYWLVQAPATPRPQGITIS